MYGTKRGSEKGRIIRAMRLVAAVGALLLGVVGVSTAAVDTDGDEIPDPTDNCLRVKNANQADTNGDDFGNACDADLNDDGIVNFADLALMKRVFFKADADADLNGDGVVNFADLAILKAAFFKPPGPSGLLPAVLPVFDVTKTGLTSEEARQLGSAFNVEALRSEDGSVHFVSDQLANVPMQQPVAAGLAAADAELPRDEDGRETSAQAFDVIAIQKLVPLGERDALAATVGGFAEAKVPLPGAAGAVMTKVSHTTLNLRSLDGQTSFSQPIDTSVRFDFSLAERPLLGPGAKVRLTYAPNGQVTGLGYATRDLAEGKMSSLTSPFDARRECAQHYPEGSKLQTPRLVYWAPGLEQNVQSIFPHWECRGKGPSNAELVPAVIPAVQDAGPSATIGASVQGAHVMASVGVRGGTPPFSYSWQSLTTELSAEASSNPSLSYDVMPRSPTDREIIAVTITDGNGLVGKARAVLPVATMAAAGRAASIPLPLSIGTLDVGGEFNVYDWQCVKQSAAGFKSVFDGQGVPIRFRWTGTNAWERDFRQTGAPTNGDDTSYVDDVDLAWYTGHGSPGSFTFDNPSHDDGDIVPTDARWGDRDLEWMQLESCNVLQFDSGGVAIWDRWAKVFDGLHLLNGFQTTASCVDTANGTAGRFSRYLFPRPIFFFTLPALKVRQAWAQMAYDLEPAGKQYVTMGAAAAGWVTNYDDYFWGEGSVGFDIPKSQIIGYWWLMGEV